MSDVDTAPILVGVSDLFFATRISETAKQVGARVGFAGAAPQLLAKISPSTRLMIVDLNSKALDPVATIAKLKSDPELASISITAFVNHECADLIEAAQQAGCDQVLNRGAFSAQLAGLLKRHR